MDAGEPADLLHMRGRRTVARWLFRSEHPAFEEDVMLGWLPDGRWWVDATSGHGVGRIFRDDASARAYAEALMARPRGQPGVWVPVRAEYGPDGASEAPPYPPGDPRARG